MERLRRNLLHREILRAKREGEDVEDDINDFEFEKLKKQAKEEVKNNLARLIYRAKYNLPPNDPRFLDLTDEEIVYELVLQSEYNKWAEDRVEETDDSDKNRVIYRNTDEYEAIVSRLEKGEDVDLDSLMTPPDEWEKIDG